MPNYNKLILTSSDYKIVMVFPGGGAYPLLTVESMSTNISVEEELIYAVGEEDAIGNKRNARKASGKLNIQVGEISAILLLEGLVDSTRISNVTIATSAIIGGFQRTFKNVNINTESIDVKAKDKQSMASLDWTALSMV